MKRTILILLSVILIVTCNACANNSVETESVVQEQITETSALEDPFENAGLPALFSTEGGGNPLLAPFFLLTDNSNDGKNSLNDIPYELFVSQEEFMAWIESEGNAYLRTPQTRLTDYPNFYSFILEFDIPVDKLREVLKEQQLIGIENDAQYLTDEEIETLCSLDEKRILEQFASEYTIVTENKGYPPSWVYLNPIEEYEKAGITSDMITEKVELFSVFNYNEEAAKAFEEKLSDFIGYDVTIGENSFEKE